MVRGVGWAPGICIKIRHIRSVIRKERSRSIRGSGSVRGTNIDGGKGRVMGGIAQMMTTAVLRNPISAAAGAGFRKPAGFLLIRLLHA